MELTIPDTFSPAERQQILLDRLVARRLEHGPSKSMKLAGGAFLDPFEQTVLTELIRREYDRIVAQAGGGENRQLFASRILPLKQQNGRHVRIRVREIFPFGLAQLKAPGATPALWTPKPMLREEVIEIVDIDEFSRIDPVKLLALKSPDPNVANDAIITIQELGAALQQRNDLRTEWMRWEALKGTLVLTFPAHPGGANTITIDYGIPAAHFPVVGTAWSNVANADPIEDLWSLSAVTIPNSGIYLSDFHMTSENFRFIRRSTKVRDALSSYGRSVMLPTNNDLRDLLRDGTNQIHIVDSGYLPENATNKVLTKFIASDKVLATPEGYNYAGRPIGDVADGWVLVNNPNAPNAEPIARQGMQSETISNPISKHTVLRQASARIPRLYAPEAIAWLDTQP